MPQNKNFQKRITILDECFSSRTGHFTLERLIDVVSEKLDISVSRKTIQNDIKYIKDTIENKKSAKMLIFSIFSKKMRKNNIDVEDEDIIYRAMYDTYLIILSKYYKIKILLFLRILMIDLQNIFPL